MKELKSKKGFTLAETLITLTILGVVAAITVPSLINKQIESANRTKVKKAMAVYEKALNQMVIDNDLKTNDAIIAFGQEKDINNNPCGSTRPYFKSVENGYDNCTFMTADRVWWNISDIQNPIISLKDKIDSEETLKNMTLNARSLKSDHTSFVLLGHIDDNILRINDNSYEQKNGKYVEKKYMAKLWEFLTGYEQELTERETFYKKYLNNEYQLCGHSLDECSANLSLCNSCYTQNDDGSRSYFENNQYLGYVTAANNKGERHILFTNGASAAPSNMTTTFYDNGKIKSQWFSSTEYVYVNGTIVGIESIKVTYNYDEDGNYIGCTPINSSTDCRLSCSDNIYKCE